MTTLTKDILETLFHYEKKYHNTKDKKVLIELDGMLILVSKLIAHNFFVKKEQKTITYKINKFVSYVKRT